MSDIYSLSSICSARFLLRDLECEETYCFTDIADLLNFISVFVSETFLKDNSNA